MDLPAQVEYERKQAEDPLWGCFDCGSLGRFTTIETHTPDMHEFDAEGAMSLWINDGYGNKARAWLKNNQPKED